MVESGSPSPKIPGLSALVWRVLLVGVIVGPSYTHAFRCHSCAYSYSPEEPDADDACVLQPEIYTGYQQLKCEHNCVVRETYNHQLDKVVAYWRHCTDKVDSGHCTGDPLYGLVTCVYTCTGDLCNTWVRGQLHTVFAGRDYNNHGRSINSYNSN
ncbi:hypothetical protein EGW08_012319, partial [Elysia chlorotica]